MKENKKKRSSPSSFSNIYSFILLAGKWVLTGRKDVRHYAMERLANAFNPKFHFTEYGQIWRDDKVFEEVYTSFEEDNFRSIDRKYTVKEFLKLTKNLEGDTAECGSYKGHTSFLICEFISHFSNSKQHHVFDSFDGLSEPLKEDGSYWTKGDLTTSEDICRNNLSSFNFVKFHKGWIPERFSEVNDRRFSFVHIDVDLYQPTLDSISFFYERLNTGGVMICDDYGFNTCPGAKKAMDDFFASKKESVILLTTGQSFIIKV